MFPIALKEELINSLSSSGTRRRCVLCGTDLKTYLDELPCPHWFITSGRRAFSERHLRSIFNIYDVPHVIEYLKVVSTFDRVGRREVTTTDHSWSIIWRERKWIFERHGGPSAAFTLSVFNGTRKAGSWQIADPAV